MDTETISRMLFEVADEFILPRFGADAAAQGVEQKGRKGDVVTLADKEAEAEITHRLRAQCPDALVLGEESAYVTPELLDALPDAEAAWVIDPVDGTLNFTRDSPDFAVMVAEVRHGEAVRGWIYQPAHKELWIAEKGAGVTRNGEQLTPPDLDDAELQGATYIPLKREADMPAPLKRSWGSCGIDYPKLVQGEIGFLAYRSIFPWDHLPGGLMVTELGGVLAVDGGTPYRPGVIGRRLVAAMTPARWQRADQLLTDWGR
jgi:fructose-1,6-bisphosphatase/inositol monophosphatase family enzyme